MDLEKFNKINKEFEAKGRFDCKKYSEGYPFFKLRCNTCGKKITIKTVDDVRTLEKCLCGNNEFRIVVRSILQESYGEKCRRLKAENKE